jgi:hypothetical protein
MGEVYKAYYSRLGRYVALKTLLPGGVEPRLLERLAFEAKACAALNHPAIVTIYDFFQVEGQPFISMELLEGESLETAIDRGALHLERRIDILVAMLDALDYAHSQGVIHRDVKPSNVRLLPNGTVKLLDFGLAHVAREKSLTLTGTVMGTPHYMSPEQFNAQPVDLRTDIYSAGVVAYELLTGRKPFPGTQFSAVMLNALTNPLPPFDNGWSSAFPELEHIVARAMSKSASDRYASAADMRDAFRNFLAHSIGAVRRMETEIVELADKTAQQARTLIAEGRGPEAEQLLAALLNSHPSAYGARELLKSTVERPSDVPVQALGLEPTLEHPRSRWPMALAMSVINRRSREVVVAASALVAVTVALMSGVGWQSGISDAVARIFGAGSPSAISDSTPIDSITPPSANDDPDVSPPPVEEPGLPPLTPEPEPPALPIKPVKPIPAKPVPPVVLPTAKELFFAPSAAGESAAQPGLQYQVLQVKPDGAEEDVDPRTVFRSGDRIRLSVQSNIDGHLYVVHRGASGRWGLLFPNSAINSGRNAVSAFRRYTVPPGENTFRFNETVGTESLFIVLSRSIVPALPSFVPEDLKGPVIQQAVVDQLRATLQARDLVLERVHDGGSIDEEGNFAVNNDAGADALTVSFELDHR